MKKRPALQLQMYNVLTSCNASNMQFTVHDIQPATCSLLLWYGMVHMIWYGLVCYGMHGYVQNLTLNWCLGHAGEAQCTHKPSGPETLSLVEHTMLCWKKQKVSQREVTWNTSGALEHTALLQETLHRCVLERGCNCMHLLETRNTGARRGFSQYS